MGTTPDLICEVIETPIGDLVLIADENGALRVAEFANCRHRMDRWLSRRLGSTRLVEGRVPEAIKAAFAAYFDGDLSALSQIPVALDGTVFQNEVWSALRQIAPGRTFAYGAFAERLGPPTVGASGRPRQRRQSAVDRHSLPSPCRRRRSAHQLWRRHRAQTVAARP
jgi:O6-methylguanine-DNA--protein-cysteine methyltransferase